MATAKKSAARKSTASKTAARKEAAPKQDQPTESASRAAKSDDDGRKPDDTAPQANVRQEVASQQEGPISNQDKYPDDSPAHRGVSTPPTGQGGASPKVRPDHQDMFPAPETLSPSKETQEKAKENAEQFPDVVSRDERAR